ncbi:exported hypothetical protein [Vibrio chagasii]|nr:exported hypothetical protein [Vibrio chagasii]
MNSKKTNKLMTLVTLSLFSTTVLATTTPIKFYIDSEVLKDYTKTEVSTKISELIEHSNNSVKPLGIRRTISSIDFIESKNKYHSPEIEHHALTSPIESSIGVYNLFFDEPRAHRILNESKRNEIVAYKVFMGYPRKDGGSCGASLHSEDTNQLQGIDRSVVINFDTLGNCSGDWLLTHELGHVDGLGHSTATCKDGTANIMAPFSSGVETRSMFTGDEGCPARSTNHLADYKESAKQLSAFNSRARPMNLRTNERGELQTSNIRFNTTNGKLHLVFDIEHELKNNRMVTPVISYIEYKNNERFRKTLRLEPVRLNNRQPKATVIVAATSNDHINAFAALQSGNAKVTY